MGNGRVSFSEYGVVEDGLGALPMGLSTATIAALALAMTANGSNQSFTSAGTPTTAFNGVAIPGAPCLDTTNGIWYINTGTLAANTWTEIGALPIVVAYTPAAGATLTLPLTACFPNVLSKITVNASAGALTVKLPTAVSAAGLDCRMKVKTNATGTYAISTDASQGVQATGYWNGGTPTYSTTAKSDWITTRSDGTAWYGTTAIIGLTAGS